MGFGGGTTDLRLSARLSCAVTCTRTHRRVSVPGNVQPDIFAQLERIEWDTLLFFYGVLLGVDGPRRGFCRRWSTTGRLCSLSCRWRPTCRGESGCWSHSPPELAGRCCRWGAQRGLRSWAWTVLLGVGASVAVHYS